MYRLTKPQALLCWFIIALLSSIVIIGDCCIQPGCSAPLLFSLLSISLGGVGTIILAIPSLLIRLGRSDDIQQAKQFNQAMYDAFVRLNEGKTLNEGEDEYEAMLEFLNEHADFEEDPPTISKGSTSGGLFNYIAVDGKNTDITTFDVKSEMKSFERGIHEAEEWEEDVQERLYVLLGCGVYGLAIIFQALATIIPNLDSFNL